MLGKIYNRQAEIIETVQKINSINMKQWKQYFQILYQNNGNNTDLMPEDNEPEDMLSISEKDIHNIQHSKREKYLVKTK